MLITAFKGIIVVYTVYIHTDSLGILVHSNVIQQLSHCQRSNRLTIMFTVEVVKLLHIERCFGQLIYIYEKAIILETRLVLVLDHIGWFTDVSCKNTILVRLYLKPAC